MTGRLLAVIACLTAAGCGGSGIGAEAQVRADYASYWDAFEEASAAADPDHPPLHRHAGGEQLAALRRNLANARTAHRVTRGSVAHDIRSVTVDGERARVVDCIDLDRWLYHDSRTGLEVADQLVDKPERLVAFTLAMAERRWVVTANRDVGPC